MTERRLAFRQCDVERAIRAAQATGAGNVVVRRDGSIVIETTPRPADHDRIARNGEFARGEELVF